MLSSITVPLEKEPQLEDVVRELAAEPMSPGTLPLPIHNLECNILCIDEESLSPIALQNSIEKSLSD